MGPASDRYGTTERQRALLQTLKDADRFLTENDISYSLCGGSLLGAIRHDGFIPWDDDIDIMMDRENYDRLLSRFHKCETCFLQRTHWFFRIQSRTPFARGGTPFIDVFALDNCPDNAIIREAKLLIIKILQGMLHEGIELRHSPLENAMLWTTYTLGRPFSYEFKIRLYELVAQIGNGRRTRRLGSYHDIFRYLSLLYPPNLMERIVRHKFEDAEMPITCEYDAYLTIHYGDYMRLPPEEERIPEHGRA